MSYPYVQTNKKLIVGGDFNLCLRPIDNSNFILKKSKARDDVIQIMENYNLLDIWRVHHPDTKRFSWRRNNPNTHCRLDYWLIGAEICYDNPTAAQNLLANTFTRK